MSVLLAAAALFSGLHGIVTRGPITPVCNAGVTCVAPAGNTQLVFSRTGHRAVRVRTDASGHYLVQLPPGDYTVRVAPLPKIGSGLRPRHVHVARSVYARLDFSIDSGIR